VSPRKPFARSHPLLFLTAGLILFAAACGDDGSPAQPGDTIDREHFIATYVDLRVTALSGEGRELTDDERARVLSEHEVTEEQLLAFAEAHGEDLPYMKEVWNEVELRLDAERPREER
jgi:hypothetical protein